MPSASEIIANKGLIRGFYEPLFYDEFSGAMALKPEDFAKVRDGYACANAQCRAEFVTYLVRCPICGHERDLAADLADPEPLHVEHLRARAAAERAHEGEEFDSQGRLLGPDGKPLPPSVPRGFDEFMADVQANPEVDQIRLSQLKKRRRK